MSSEILKFYHTDYTTGQNCFEQKQHKLMSNNWPVGCGLIRNKHITIGNFSNHLWVYGDGGIYMSIQKPRTNSTAFGRNRKDKFRYELWLLLFISFLPNPFKFECLIMRNNVPTPTPTKTLRNSDHLWTNFMRFFTKKLVRS